MSQKFVEFALGDERFPPMPISFAAEDVRVIQPNPFDTRGRTLVQTGNGATFTLAAPYNEVRAALGLPASELPMPDPMPPPPPQQRPAPSNLARPIMLPGTMKRS